MTTQLVRYLLTSAVLGGVAGVGHGAARGSAFNDGLHGLILGPWAPVLIPLRLTLWRANCSCPFLNKRFQYREVP
jgi:hypothetical protein